MEAFDVFVVCVLTVGIKLLLLPCYHSTDFEVHRNWVAITGHLPLKEWYFDEGSIWTLDYPPFFAYFEWLLFQLSRFIDPNLIQLTNYADSRFSVVIFQRLTVILTEFVLVVAVMRYMNSVGVPKRHHAAGLALVIGNAGLILVDHIHFQYNGFLIGVLVLTLDACNRGQYRVAAGLFSVLVYLKHLFVPLAFPFGIFLLVNFGFHKGHFKIFRFIQLVMIAGIVSSLALGPFLIQDNGIDQIKQMAIRLFPFGRGLVHTYWAPNIWALYCFFDRLLIQTCAKISRQGLILSVCQLSPDFNTISSSTAGILGTGSAFAYIPAVSAAMCLVLTVIAMVPALYFLVKNPNSIVITDVVVYCSLCSFMFGYHVHEKAILIPLLLVSLSWIRKTAVANSMSMELQGTLMYLLSLSGIHGLLPLFTGIRETPVKILLLCGYITFVLLYASCFSKELMTVRRLFAWGLLGLSHLVVILFTEVLHPLFFTSAKLQFLPLMLTSVFCALQNIVCLFISFIVVYREACFGISGCESESSLRGEQLKRKIT